MSSSGRSLFVDRDSPTDPVGRMLRLVAPRPTRRLGPGGRVGLRALVEHRWQDHAACATGDPESWFPVNGSIPVVEVSRICAACPVNRSCLAVAMLWDEDGIWAGTNAGQRTQGYRLLRLGVSAAAVVELLLAQAKRPHPEWRRWSDAAASLTPRPRAGSPGPRRGGGSGGQEDAA